MYQNLIKQEFVPRCKHSVLILAFWLTLFPTLISGVIVDGDEKDELSPIVNQKSDAQLTIDPFNTKSCGIADPNADEHEFVGMAREGQFPWLVSFQIKIVSGASYADQLKAAKRPEGQEHIKTGENKVENLHFCCGSFISDRWILSAAHCFADDTIKNYLRNDKLVVVAGSHKVSSRSPLNKNLTIGRIYHHGQFNKSIPVGFDIALVELTQPVNFTTERAKNEFGEQKAPHMTPICLPKRDNRYKFNESARIAGWGLSHAKDVHSMPSKLLTTDILLADQKECAKEYARRLKSNKPLERSDYLCASYKKTRDACQSDSGGPLMQYVNRKAVVIGIVSYGIGCATKGVPGLYTKTSSYINWIKDITRNGPNAQVEFKMLESEEGRAKLRAEERKQAEEDAAKDFKFFDET